MTHSSGETQGVARHMRCFTFQRRDCEETDVVIPPNAVATVDSNEPSASSDDNLTGKKRWRVAQKHLVRQCLTSPFLSNICPITRAVSNSDVLYVGSKSPRAALHARVFVVKISCPFIHQTTVATVWQSIAATPFVTASLPDPSASGPVHLNQPPAGQRQLLTARTSPRKARDTEQREKL